MSRTPLVWRLRPARKDEFAALAELEGDAATALVEAGALSAQQAGPGDQALLARAWAAGWLRVAAGSDDIALGFLAAFPQDGALYIAEVDVGRAWQGRGIGRALLADALARARGDGLWGAMLTTDRHAPFNRPFYESFGFCEASARTAPASLLARLAREQQLFAEPQRRMAMVLRFKAGESSA